MTLALHQASFNRYRRLRRFARRNAHGARKLSRDTSVTTGNVGKRTTPAPDACMQRCAFPSGILIDQGLADKFSRVAAPSARVRTGLSSSRATADVAAPSTLRPWLLFCGFVCAGPSASSRAGFGSFPDANAIVFAPLRSQVEVRLFRTVPGDQTANAKPNVRPVLTRRFQAQTSRYSHRGR